MSPFTGDFGREMSPFTGCNVPIYGMPKLVMSPFTGFAFGGPHWASGNGGKSIGLGPVLMVHRQLSDVPIVVTFIS